MAVKKVVKPEDDVDDTDDDGDGSPQVDPREEAKGMLREVVDEALADWTKKNKPAPRKTHQEDETSIGWFESLFGAKP